MVTNFLLPWDSCDIFPFIIFLKINKLKKNHRERKQKQNFILQSLFHILHYIPNQKMFCFTNINCIDTILFQAFSRENNYTVWLLEIPCLQPCYAPEMCETVSITNILQKTQGLILQMLKASYNSHLPVIRKNRYWRCRIIPNQALSVKCIQPHYMVTSQSKILYFYVMQK